MRSKIKGIIVRDLRVAKNVSQRGMAKIINIPYTTLRTIEAVGKDQLSQFKVDLEVIKKIAKYLDTHYLKLLPYELKEKNEVRNIAENTFDSYMKNISTIDLNFFKISSAKEILKFCNQQELISVVNVEEKITAEDRENFLNIIEILEKEIQINLNQKFKAIKIEKESDRLKRIFDFSDKLKLLDSAGLDVGYALIGQCTGVDVDEFGNGYWVHPKEALTVGIRDFLLISLVKKKQEQIDKDIKNTISSDKEMIVDTIEYELHHQGIENYHTDKLQVEKIFSNYRKFIVNKDRVSVKEKE